MRPANLQRRRRRVNTSIDYATLSSAASMLLVYLIRGPDGRGSLKRIAKLLVKLLSVQMREVREVAKLCWLYLHAKSAKRADDVLKELVGSWKTLQFAALKNANDVKKGLLKRLADADGDGVAAARAMLSEIQSSRPGVVTADRLFVSRISDAFDVAHGDFAEPAYESIYADKEGGADE